MISGGMSRLMVAACRHWSPGYLTKKGPLVAPSGREETDFSNIVRERTRALHARAERSGIIRDILRRRADRLGYALLLRNLLPAYEEMERGLDLERQDSVVAPLAQPAVYRAKAIRSDLAQLCGTSWRRDLPLLAEGDRYACRVAAAAGGDGAPLLAHAYVRYLGDLNGGQVLKQLLAESLALGPEALSFYDFPKVSDLDGFRAGFRKAIDQAAAKVSDCEGLIAEAETAFQLNIEVSEAVRRAAAEPARAPYIDAPAP